jgi:hypothetical protein
MIGYFAREKILEEEGISKDREGVEKTIEKVFRTVTGKRLAEKIYPVRKPHHL